MSRFPHLGTPQSKIRVPHNELQMIHPTQQLSGSALRRVSTRSLLRSDCAVERAADLVLTFAVVRRRQSFNDLIQPGYVSIDTLWTFLG